MLKEYLYGKVCFRSENYIATPLKEQFDTITCLSTVKWVHLNFGDTGIKALFLKVYESLSPGGLFVLEPQPWKSYKKKKHLTPTIRENYKTICLKPSFFLDYLVNHVGFKHLWTQSPLKTNKGFDRPIMLLQKPDN